MNISDEYRLKLTQLTDLFERNRKQYNTSAYDEANTRTDFIDKFFELLGWDMRNEQGYSEQYREVVREDKVRINGKVKAPDYAFRIGGVRKFFVEAKKPSVNIKDELEPAFQVRRYGYTAKLPLCILTNFAEFAVYDTRIKPSPSDKPDTARIFCRSYLEYHKYFDFIVNTFSKEAILKGSFDSYIQENKNKKGTSEVDKELLKLIEGWRTDIAKNIALRNPSLNIYHLNTAVQKIIDRIIFLRIAEDKEMEEYGLLQKITESGAVYQKLQSIFDRANKKYNSGLFKPHDWLRSLIIDDAVLSSIINGLYYPECPYEFSILPVEILGNIYEQFLGKIIKFRNVKGGHTALIEEKPEVKKAGGVYYTPQYIVRYIVENTLGVKIKGQSPDAIAQLKVVDPACGSGSFLVEAYQQLLNYHLDYYSSEKQRKQALKNNRIYETGKNVYKLTIEEKQRILLNSIYGVDIDGQAVEVTKLSLYLKLLENEGSETKGRGQLFNFSDIKLLPSLDLNIKCGNSLVGSDYYNEKDVSLFDDEAMRKINTFDWDKEFPEVFAQGGFDCVIGNPPYVRIQILNEANSDLVQFYNSKYSNIVSGSYDLYILFIYKGFSLLNKSGILGFIQPHKFFQAETGEKIRILLNKEKALSQIVDFTTNQIFENATTYTCLLFLEKAKKENFLYKRFELNEDFTMLDNLHFETISCSALDNSCWLFHSGVKDILLKKIGNQAWNFKDITSKIFKGSSTGNDKIFLFDLVEEQEDILIVKSTISSKNIPIEKGIMRKFLYGEDVRRYENPSSKKWLLFPYEKISEKYCLLDVKKLKNCFPLAYSYLNEHKSTLLSRKLPLTNTDFYKYSAARSLNDYEQPKILIPDMLVQNRITYDIKGEFFTGPAIHCPIFNQQASYVDSKLYLTILNSKLFWFFISNTSTALRGNAYRLTPEYLIKFSFPKLENTELLCTHLITLADQMLETQSRLQHALSDEDKKLLEQRAAIIDKQIDRAVYKLYGLTEDEVKIVENS